MAPIPNATTSSSMRKTSRHARRKRNLTVEVEAKAKELAVLRLIETLARRPKQPH